MFQILTEALITSKNDVDSLKNAIKHLEIKVDSLQRITEKAEIGSGFFSEIISLQLALFLFLVGLAGFFSWKWFVTKIETAKEEATTKATKLLTDHTTKYEGEMLNIRSELLEANFNITRSMYNVARTTKFHRNTFDWALASAASYVKAFEQNIKTTTLLFWLDESFKYLSKIEPSNNEVKNKMEVYDADFNTIEIVKDEEVISRIKILKEKLYHIAYTISMPPENLLENEHATPPPNSDIPT